MLEKSVWRNYHERSDLGETLAAFYGLDCTLFVEDERELYGILKAKLTKKELKLFAMDSALVDETSLCEAFEIDAAGAEILKQKLYKKMKNDHFKKAFLAKNHATLS